MQELIIRLLSEINSHLCLGGPMDLTNATREVFWQIPFSFKVIMYVLMFSALGVFFYGVWKKYQFVTQGQGLKSLKPEKLNIKSFIETIFFTGS